MLTSRHKSQPQLLTLATAPGRARELHEPDLVIRDPSVAQGVKGLESDRHCGIRLSGSTARTCVSTFGIVLSR
jgi:hypothetical protein